jgi:hypothetical protein
VGRAPTADELRCLGLKQGRAVRVQVCSPAESGWHLARKARCGLGVHVFDCGVS